MQKTQTSKISGILSLKRDASIVLICKKTLQEDKHSFYHKS